MADDGTDGADQSNEVPAELPGDVTVERAVSDEVDILADLWVDLAADQRQHGSHLRADANRPPIRETMLQHVVSGTVLVARRGDDAVGFVTFGPESGRYQQNARRGIIHNIYVRPADRGVGIGSALLERAESVLDSMGVDAIALESMADNDAAKAFYRHHGYLAHRIELEKPINDDPVGSDDG